MSAGDEADGDPADARKRRRKRPDRAAHHQHKKTVHERCVKMRLRSFCRTDAIVAEIDASVRTLTQMAFEALPARQPALQPPAGQRPAGASDSPIAAAWRTWSRTCPRRWSATPGGPSEAALPRVGAHHTFTTIVSHHLLTRLSKLIKLRVVQATRRTGGRPF
ncbi:g2871 [Coccomyxa elongata]